MNEQYLGVGGRMVTVGGKAVKMPQGVGGAVTGSYTGNGDRQKNLSLGFESAAILIMSSSDGGSNVYMFVAVNGAPNGLGISSSSTSKNRVEVNFSDEGILMGNPTGGDVQQFNRSGTVYNYIAIPKA